MSVYDAGGKRRGLHLPLYQKRCPEKKGTAQAAADVSVFGDAKETAEAVCTYGGALNGKINQDLR